jgi:hypothetical protein
MEEVAKYEPEPQEKKVIQEKKEIQKADIQDQITSLIPLAGTIELTKEQEEILYASVVDEQVEIRPDGLIYLPWMEYVTRLRKAFGMSWTLIPYGPPKKLEKFIHWAFWLIIKGKPYGFAVGEQQYFESDHMTYGDALEGAKSNALMRLCKGLGISLELWQPEFRRKWLPKYAESYLATYPDGKPILDKHGKQKTYWRKKGSPKNEENGDIASFKEISPKSTAKPKEDFPKIMEREKERIGDEKFFEILGDIGYESIEMLSQATREEQIKVYKAISGIK